MIAMQKHRRVMKVGLALAAIAIGAIAFGVPWTTVLFVALVLCCPLMMLFMDHGMHGGGCGAR